MILPIIAYGHPVLKRKAEVINKDYPKLKELIENLLLYIITQTEGLKTKKRKLFGLCIKEGLVKKIIIF